MGEPCLCICASRQGSQQEHGGLFAGTPLFLQDHMVEDFMEFQKKLAYPQLHNNTVDENQLQEKEATRHHLFTSS
jgi:hypothetical protein